MKKNLSVFILLILFFSCDTETPSVYNKIFISAEGDFRGVSIRSTLEEVKKTESISPKNEESDYLFYEFPLSKKEDYFTVGYSFNEKGLYEILLDVNLENTEEAMQLFKELKRSFNERFGNPKQEEETTVVWTINSKNSEEVEITLTDESASYQTGKISVSFYDLSY